jgi:hypothetical protein
MPPTVSELLRQAPKTPDRLEEVDVSAFFGEPVVFKYRYPTVVMESIAANVDAPRLKRRHPDWSDQMCVLVSLLAQMHVDPPVGDEPSGIVYERIAVEHDPLFRFLVLEVSQRFPELRMAQALDEQKKGSIPTGGD